MQVGRSFPRCKLTMTSPAAATSSAAGKSTLQVATTLPGSSASSRTQPLHAAAGLGLGLGLGAKAWGLDASSACVSASVVAASNAPGVVAARSMSNCAWG